MQVKGKLQSEGSRTCLTANINGRVFKSWLVDQEGTIHLFTKVHCTMELSKHLLVFHSRNFVLCTRLGFFAWLLRNYGMHFQNGYLFVGNMFVNC